VNGLLDIPGSRYAAAVAGSPRFLGWDEHAELLAQIRDLIRFLLPGLVGAKVPESAAYPRPARRDEKPAEPQAGSIADFDTGAFLAGRW